MPDELLNSINQALVSILSMIDKALIDIPNTSFFGVTLTLDQRQISETKSLISCTLAKIDKIKQEIVEGDSDWGAAERLALERLTDDNIDFTSGKEMFDWIEHFEAGEDV